MALNRLAARPQTWALLAALLLTLAVYWPGLSGAFLFDDYPNIVDNHGVQPTDASVPSLVRAALSSPASEFKRPLASLSFAANYLATGLDPYWMKLTNLLIHLLNGLLVFVLAGALLRTPLVGARLRAMPFVDADESIAREQAPTTAPQGLDRHAGIVAALIAGAWMLLPINLTGVLYVVQRMESMANAFVLFGLIGYVAGRQRMLAPAPAASRGSNQRAFWLCAASITVPVAFGVLAKETAVMLPLYAVLIEWALFGFRKASGNPYADSWMTGARMLVGRALPAGLLGAGSSDVAAGGARPTKDFLHAGASDAAAAGARPTDGALASGGARDGRIVALFLLVLALPITVGLAWLAPHIFSAQAWATRDFTLGTRLLSEARIVADYVHWTLLPTPDALSFYHDQFRISTGLLKPWTTLASIAFLAALMALTIWLRRRQPIAALGISLFLGCQLLTGTVLPLELIYEHRNYFASFGLLLAVVPLLAAPSRRPASTPMEATPVAVVNDDAQKSVVAEAPTVATTAGSLPLALPRYVLLAGLLLSWTALTAFTAYAWGDPLRLAQDLAQRAPLSPRAQYELGRTYIIYSRYEPASPYTPLAYAPLERAAALPGSSILPQQALIFMNARMHLPLKDAWWDSLIAKLKARPLGVQDESSLGALTQCARKQQCDLPKNHMVAAFIASLSHPNPSARLLATYGDYAWNVLDDHALGLRMTEEAVNTEPNEPAYRITLIRMLIAQGDRTKAADALQKLESLNIGGRLDASLEELRALPGLR